MYVEKVAQTCSKSCSLMQPKLRIYAACNYKQASHWLLPYATFAASICSISYVYMQLWLRLYTTLAAPIRNFCYVLMQLLLHAYVTFAASIRKITHNRIAALTTSFLFIINMQHTSLSEIDVALNFMV